MSSDRNTAGEVIERWKRGLAAVAFVAVTITASIFAAGAPMMLLGEVLNYPPLQSLPNIVIVAVVLALPWIITSDGAARAIREVLLNNVTKD